ncbi:lytic transglycosylase domain-containing protein [Novosphingobium profundi]|nr:lytic transglycosylase domain-containing protein [Novosphingobium profundi]
MCCWSTPVLARRAADEAQEAIIGRCIHEAAGGQLWLERTLWGLRDQEAGWIGAEIANANGTHDLGPLQINSFWIKPLARLTQRPPDKVRQWLTGDACFNVQAARWIFLAGLRTSKTYWQAVGAYHSPTSSRQAKYADAVARKLRKRFGIEVFPVTSDQPLSREEL